MLHHFIKMHALGNDFLLVDATKQKLIIHRNQIKMLSDRQRGVGFDQLLLLESSKDQRIDFHLRIFNADGKEVGQCGNGARCAALYAHAFHLTEHSDITLSTITSKMHCTVLSEQRVAVELSPPQLSPAFTSDTLTIDGEACRFDIVNVGNPHAICWVDSLSHDLNALGQALNEHPHFPDGVNVSLASMVDKNHVQLRVFERGVGQTLACGSAACAAMAAGHQKGWLAPTVVVSQPGGDLEINWRGGSAPLEMIGEAHIIFSGKLYESALLASTSVTCH